MSKAPKVTIVVLNYNGLEDTRECLRSLFKTRYPSFDVLLVDNGSKVDEAKVLQKEFKDKRIKFIRFNKNWGFAGGNNRAVKRSKSKYIVLLNNDTVVDPNWIDELVKVVETDPKIAACQAKILSLRKPEYFEFAGAAGGFLDRLGYPYTRGRVGFHLEKDVGQYDQVIDIFWASGTCLLARRKLFLELGSFDQEFFAYQEEIDLCWRAKRAGFRVVFCPKAVVFHKGMGATISRLAWKTFLVHRNNLKLIIKNLSFPSLLWVFPTRLILDWAGVLFYLITGQHKFVFSVLKAHFETLCTFKNEFLKRRELEKRVPYYKDEELFPASIYWEYFVKGKRRFNEILGKKGGGAPLILYEDLLSLKRIARLERSPTTALNTLATKKAFLFLSIIIIALLFRLPSLTMPLDRDEGTYAYIGWSWIEKGVVPYRDVFDHKPPLGYIVYGLISFFGGNSLLTIRTVALIYFLFSLGIFFYFSTKFWGKFAALFSSLMLLFLIHTPLIEGWGFNTEMLFVPWTLLNFGWFVEGVKSQRSRRLKWVLAGFAGGIAGLFKPIAFLPAGMLLFAVLINKICSSKGLEDLLQNIRLNIRDTVLYVISLGTPLLIVFSYFYLSDAFDAYYLANLEFNRNYILEGFKLGNIQKFTGLSGTFMPYLKFFVSARGLEVQLAIFVFLISSYIFYNKGKLFYFWINVFFVGALFLGVKLGGARHVGHYYLPLVWGAAFTSGGVAFIKSRKTKKLLLMIVLVLTSLRVFQYYDKTGEYISKKQFGTQESWFTDSELVGKKLKLIMEEAEVVYVWANEPQIYYFAEKTSPSYFLYFYVLDNYPNGWEMWEKELKSGKEVDYIVTYKSKDEPMHSTLKTYLEKREYKEIHNNTSFRILKREI